MKPFQGYTPVWRDRQGIDRLLAQVEANDAKLRKERADAAAKSRAHISAAGRQVITKIDKIEALMLPAFDAIAVQKELGISNGMPTMRTPACPNGFGGDCDYPRCACASPQQKQQAREPEDHDAPASIKHLAVMATFTAIASVVAIVSTPALLARATEVLKSWF